MPTRCTSQVGKRRAQAHVTWTAFALSARQGHRWIKDDEGAFAVELKWLNMPGTAERNLFVVISHDEEQRRQHVEARRRRRWLGVMWFCRAMAKNLPRVPCYSQAFRVRQVGIERG